jgi:uncharacterized protein YigE (DUF2233 family)
MRVTALVALALLGACRSSTTTTSAGSEARVDAGAGTGALTDAGSAYRESSIRDDGRDYAVKTFSFRVADVEAFIEDARMSASLDDVRAKADADLVVNGGFFDVDERPLGLAVSRGAALSPFSRTMSGGVFVIDDERATLTATEDADGGVGLPRFAVQCRPRLVVDRRVNIKGDDGKRAARTALCARENGAIVDVIVARDRADKTYGPSLLALAQHLAAAGCEGALNLDGGPSTGAAWRDANGAHAELPAAAVRHALVWKLKH